MGIHPAPRCATMPDGNIEAAYSVARRVVVDKRTGALLWCSVARGSDDFRRLVMAAREHCGPCEDYRDMG